eukprot:TRINITY_DN5685_c0_g1_i2.p1 TRINITY_DN5685_c0_g1~~TRINITY_DN5685_c0_g1_i2.p1  ORF type:complete len:200 (-),score=22.19 TRINITY_DN5685_c0_g1_i2:198-749(-)
MGLISPRIFAHGLSTRKYSTIFHRITPHIRTNEENLVPMIRGLSSILGLTLIPNFLNERQQQILEKDLQSIFEKKRYQKGHWDNVAYGGYREFQRSTEEFEDPETRDLFKWIYERMPKDKKYQPTHFLDLKAEGQIGPHIDSVKFVGDIVAGISLMSECIFRLQKEDKCIDLLLKPGSLYILT